MACGTEEDILLMSSKKCKWTFLFSVSIVSALGGFLFGYDTGVISGAMIQLRQHFYLSFVYQELVVSISLFAAALSCAFGAYLSDKLGRRPVILISSSVFTAGSIVMGFAYTKEILLFGRFVVGLGIGMASMTIPVYIAEISPSQLRSALVTTNTVFITAGQVIAAVVDGIFMADKTNGWRYMLGLGGIPSVIQLIAFLFMPETPRWLIQHGRFTEARLTLQHINGVKSSTPEIEDEIQNIINSIERSVQAQQSFARPNVVNRVPTLQLTNYNSFSTLNEPLEEFKYSYSRKCPCFTLQTFLSFWSRSILLRMLTYSPTRHALFVGCGLQFFQQLVGINTVMYYGASILSMSGLGNTFRSVRSLNLDGDTQIVWFAAIIAFANFLFGLASPCLITKMKRRTLFFCSLTGILLSLLLLAVSFQLMSSFSKPVTLIEPIPIGRNAHIISSECMQARSCDTCVRMSTCGFCYQLNDSDHKMVRNGSCLPSSNDFSDHSAYGRCVNSSLTNSQFFWTVDHCPTQFGWLTLIGLILYLASFAPGMSPLPWAINSEIYPTWARSTGMATATATNWIVNLIVSLTFLSLTEAISRQGTYYLYAGVTVIAILFVYNYVPEFGGKSLEEIEESFNPTNSERTC